MIVKLDHITYITDLNFNRNELLSKGYKISFEEKNLPNLLNKKEFMYYQQEKHNLLMFESAEQINIEVIEYADCLTEKNSLDYKKFGEENIIYIKTSSIEDSMMFWKNLGFEEMSNTSMKFFSSFNSEIIHINFIKIEKIIPNYLDLKGFNCLTFVSTNPMKDRLAFIDKGYLVTEIESLNVNSRHLDIFFIKTPSNQIVEIIGMKRKAD